jgi:hypothetical protein
MFFHKEFFFGSSGSKSLVMMTYLIPLLVIILTGLLNWSLFLNSRYHFNRDSKTDCRIKNSGSSFGKMSIVNLIGHFSLAEMHCLAF